MKKTARMMALALLFVMTSAVVVGCSAWGDADSSTPPAEEAVESVPAEEPADSVPVHDPEEGQEVTVGSVQLVYFHIANPCSCMAVFGGAIADSINTNFQTELASGELKFIDVVSDDAANKEIVEAFDSQPSDLFVVTTIGDAISVEPDYDIWSLMGDNEAVAQYVKGVVEAKLAGLNS